MNDGLLRGGRSTSNDPSSALIFKYRRAQNTVWSSPFGPKGTPSPALNGLQTGYRSNGISFVPFFTVLP